MCKAAFTAPLIPANGTACSFHMSSSFPPAAAHAFKCFPVPRQPIQHPCRVHWCQHLVLPCHMCCLPLLPAGWQLQPPLQQCPVMPACADRVRLVCRPAHACHMAAVAAVAVPWRVVNHTRAVEQLDLQAGSTQPDSVHMLSVKTALRLNNL
jgi:hypothetical protein